MFAKAICGKQFANRDKVALGLRHFLAFDLEMAIVDPIIRHHRRVEGATRLRDFVLMVRKDEIDAAAVDVEYLAEIIPPHGRTFDVPAGAAGSFTPAGDCHAGSPGFDGFHSTKSVGSRL